MADFSGEMVKLHVKRGDESQFLVETTVECPLSELIPRLVRLHNGCLKVDRLCQGESGSYRGDELGRRASVRLVGVARG